MQCQDAGTICFLKDPVHLGLVGVGDGMHGCKVRRDAGQIDTFDRRVFRGDVAAQPMGDFEDTLLDKPHDLCAFQPRLCNRNCFRSQGAACRFGQVFCPETLLQRLPGFEVAPSADDLEVVGGDLGQREVRRSC